MTRFYAITVVLLLASTTSFHAMENPEKTEKVQQTTTQKFPNLDINTADIDINMIKSCLDRLPKIVESFSGVLEQLHPDKYTVTKEQLKAFRSAVQATDNNLQITATLYLDVLFEDDTEEKANELNKHKNELADSSNALYEDYLADQHLSKAYVKHPCFGVLLDHAKKKQQYLLEDTALYSKTKSLTRRGITPMPTISGLIHTLESVQK
jgi:hypothetical protein